jgi:hypothetical protein
MNWEMAPGKRSEGRNAAPQHRSKAKNETQKVQPVKAPIELQTKTPASVRSQLSSDSRPLKISQVA